MSSDSVELAEGVFASSSPPFEIDPDGQGWLGSARTTAYSECELFITTTGPSNSLSVVDSEDSALVTKAFRHLLALLVLGIPDSVSGFILSGSVQISPNVRQVSPMDDHFIHPRARHSPITAMNLERSKAIAENIEYLYSEPGEFRRVRQAFSAWRQATNCKDPYDRLPLFVRSIQGFMSLQMGKTTRQFGNQCRLFAGSSTFTVDALRDLYHLRSATEHLNDWAQALTNTANDQREDRAFRLSFIAELIANHCFARAFSDRTRLNHFKSDSGVHDFANLPVADREAIWGPPLDLEQSLVDFYVS
ncbi:hypothetical protein JYT83_00435 [bacterium AH-315-F18]|nr:hypothetical protein [bacterium AH-315-F18]